MVDSEAKVQIPSKACGEGDDLGVPVLALLRHVQLLGTTEEMEDAQGFVAAFRGPPQSVALIEAGATAFSKAWAAGLGASALTVAGTIYSQWSKLDDPLLQSTVVIAGALVVVALLLALGYIIASDVKGRAAAAVATIQARVQVAASFTEAVEPCPCAEPPSESPRQVISMTPQDVRFISKPADNEAGWRAIAMEVGPENNRYLLVRHGAQEWAPDSEVRFV